MDNFKIETHKGDEYIISLEPKFTLRVIPKDKQPEDQDYPAYTTVGALFEPNEIDRNSYNSDESYALAWERAFLRAKCPVDFQGVDIFYAADDVAHCNQPAWLSAINYYCNVKFGKTVIWLQAYNYDFILSELNCTPETLASLRGENGRQK